MTQAREQGPPAAQRRDEAGGAGEFRWDVPSGAWWWSDALYELLGYQPGTVPASMELFLQHKDPADRARVDMVIDRCREDGGPFSCYHHILDAHGTRKTVVAVGRGDRDDSRTVTIHGFLVDVTAGSRADTTLALESALVHRAAIDQVKGMVMLTHQLDADAAFDLLVGHSMITNTKLTAIVTTVLDRVAHREATEVVTRADLDALLADI